MNIVHKIGVASLDFSWVSPHFFLKGWDIFFREEIDTIAYLHLFALTFSYIFNYSAWISQWQLSALIILFRRIMAGAICTSTRRLDGKTVIVTGSNTGIGKETVRNLARRGANIVMACRDMTKANEVANEIRMQTAADVTTIKLDLSSLESVRCFVKEFIGKHDSLDILINNAGVMMCPYSLTKDGFEMQFGVNHLGHFLLTNLLLPLMKKSPEPRIINLSSLAHTGANFDIDDMLYKKGYNTDIAYSNSKLANILFSRELFQRLADTNIKVFSVHPGVVQTELGRNLRLGMDLFYQYVLRFVSKNVMEGSQTTVYCATEAPAHPITYYSDCAVRTPIDAALNLDLAKKLWDMSEKLVHLDQ